MSESDAKSAFIALAQGHCDLLKSFIPIPEDLPVEESQYISTVASALASYFQGHYHKRRMRSDGSKMSGFGKGKLED